jgi:hypothetical protein
MNYCPHCGTKLQSLTPAEDGWGAHGNCTNCAAEIIYSSGDWGAPSTYTLRVLPNSKIDIIIK